MNKNWLIISLSFILLSLINISLAHAQPQWRNQGQRNNTILYGNSNILYAEGLDASGLDWAWLETNETGGWKNKTYMNMNDATDWTWSNFTWQNNSITEPAVIAWKIYYNNTSGLESVTDELTFFVAECFSNNDCSEKCVARQWYSTYSCNAQNTCDLSDLTCDVAHCNAKCDADSDCTYTNDCLLASQGETPDTPGYYGADPCTCKGFIEITAHYSNGCPRQYVYIRVYNTSNGQKTGECYVTNETGECVSTNWRILPNTFYKINGTWPLGIPFWGACFNLSSDQSYLKCKLNNISAFVDGTVNCGEAECVGKEWCYKPSGKTPYVTCDSWGTECDSSTCCNCTNSYNPFTWGYPYKEFDEQDEDCGTCYNCTGINSCSAQTDDTGNNCTDDCYDCISGTCTAMTELDDGSCDVDCDSCVNGVCTGRNQCDSTECSSGDYCDNGGGICVDPNANSQAGENVCEACVSGAQHSYLESWGFEALTTPYCCDNDLDEYYVTNGVGLEACCDDPSENCVDSGGVCRTEYPTEVTCDNIDNDCDGTIDEDLTRSCGSGSCVGTQTCTAGSWGDCSSSGTDCGTCAICDSTGTCGYDETQDEDCPFCQKCSGINSCTNQGWGEDVKEECPDGICKYGHCNSMGACAYNDTSTICDYNWKCSDTLGGDNAYDAWNYTKPSRAYCDGSGNCDWATTGGSPCNLQEGYAREGTGLTICWDGYSSCRDSCNDLFDNDYDTCMDGEDVDCGGLDTICNGEDDDCDGQWDEDYVSVPCGDDECDGTTYCDIGGMVKCTSWKTDCDTKICCTCNGGTEANPTENYNGTKNEHCDPYDLPEVAQCDYNPDNYIFTWDYHAAIDSVCEALNRCTHESGYYNWYHYCNDDDLFDGVIYGSGCGAECDEHVDCGDKCVGDIRYYSGICVWSSCNCSYSTVDCNNDDGWVDTGNTQWVEDTECTEKEQKEQTYSDYYCSESPSVACYHTNTSTQWIDTGNIRNKADETPCGDEVCDSCQTGVCTAQTGETGVGCTADCYDCNAGSCDTMTEGNDGSCNADCDSCVNGVCTGRNQCDSTECSSGDYCDNGGGICVDPNANSQAGENVCEACVSGAQHSYLESWGFEALTTPYCCDNDLDEYYVTNGVGLEACCDDPSENCVDSGGVCRTEYLTEVTCNDGIDNDCDGGIDCYDVNWNCVGKESPGGEKCCQNDNDCNYLDTDCADGVCNLNNECEQQFKLPSYVCRASAGVCDIEETCTGFGPSCPSDSYQPSGYECRPAASVCDITEECTGSSPICPIDVFEPLSTPCELDGEFCTVDHCDGSGSCVYWKDYDCSGNDITGIAICTNDPDLNPFTWDYREVFMSVCDEVNDKCPTGDETITHTCDITECGAECEVNEDCASGVCQANCTCSAVTIPTVTIISPIPKNYSVEAVWLNVTADIPVDTWEYQINSDPRTPFTPDIIINKTHGLKQCFNNLIIYATSGGEEGSASVQFYALTGDSLENRNVDIFDIVLCAGSYGDTSADPDFKPSCDVIPIKEWNIGNDKIDIFDIVAMAGNYGKKC